MKRIIIIALLCLAPLLAACNGSSSNADSAKSAAASVTADPQFLAAKALVRHCFAGTPTQQIHQVHLVFLSSSTGKHGPEVIAARTKAMNCMGISKSDEQPFINDAITQGKYGKVLLTHNGRVGYFGDALPRLVLKYSNAASVSPSPSAKATSS
jgi:hypothetical protein